MALSSANVRHVTSIISFVALSNHSSTFFLRINDFVILLIWWLNNMVVSYVFMNLESLPSNILIALTCICYYLRLLRANCV